MKTLVLNLTRFGDLLQTQPVLSGYKAQGDEVGLVCLDNFAAAAELLTDVDAVFPVPGGKLLAGVQAFWPDGVATAFEFRTETIREFQPDRIVNLTPSLSGRLLSRMLGQDFAASGIRLEGMSLDAYGFGINSSPWAAFMQTASAHRGCSPFNLVDIFCQVAALPTQNREYSLKTPKRVVREAMRRQLDGCVPDGNKGYVGFQLGASEERRRWPLAHFLRLGEMLWNELQLVPVLFGSPAERHLAERFAQESGFPHVDMIGRTSLPELAATLTEMHFLVTNDTGTMHLAAGLGTPILAIFLCTAQPWDTGPYLSGSLCLEPDMACHPCAFGKDCPNDEACRQSVTSELIFELSKSVMQGNEPEFVNLTGRGARVWQSSRDSAGFMTLKSLSGREAEDRSQWVFLQRHAYSQFLDGNDLTPLNPLASFSPETRQALVRVLSEAIGMVELLEQQGALLVVAPREKLKAKFLGFWQRLQTMLADDPFLAVIGRLWPEQSQECGNDMARVAALIARYGALLKSLFQSLA